MNKEILLRHSFKCYFLAVLFLAAWVACSSEASAKAREFPAVVEKEGYLFELQGKGYKRFLFMKAFDAGFYTTSGVSKDDLLEDVPKYLEVEYHVSIPGKSLTDYTITHMKRNVTREEFSDLKTEILQMGEYFVDLKPRDRFSLIYLPGVGTQFAHNGKLVGVVSGDKFGRALFSVWIGVKPFDPSLKRKIIGLIESEEESAVERLAALEETEGEQSVPEMALKEGS